jgi:hypothetical protein
VAFLLFLESPTVGVGNDPDPVAYMGGTDEGRRYAVPFPVVPEDGQISEYVSHSPSKETRDVFHEDVAGS